MIDINRLLTHVMSGGSPASETVNPRPAGGAGAQIMGGLTSALGGNAGSLGAGALAGGLAGILMGSKGAREVAGTALQIGAVAAIGGLAYKAYQNYRQGKPIVPESLTGMLPGAARPVPQLGTAPEPAIEAWIPRPERAAPVGHLMLQAMIAAAAADGHLDETETARIRDQLRASGLSADEQDYLTQSLAQPAGIGDLAAAATTPELRAEVYTAARLAIEPDSPAERAWLAGLAMALGLDPGLKAQIDAIGKGPPARAA